MKSAVRVKNLNFSYPGVPGVLKNLSFEILSGERVGIIGPNGAGKTSLIFHLNGLLEGDFEEFEIFGHSLRDKNNLSKIREMVGVVFQDPNDQLFMPTVFEDVGFAARQKGVAGEPLANLVRGAMEQVGLPHWLGGKMAHHLSCCEKKKVSLAAVFAQQPLILVLDEPTASLDPAGRRELLEILNKFKITLLVASHDLNLIRGTCKKVFFLNKGEQVYFGPAGAILDDEKFLVANGL